MEREDIFTILDYAERASRCRSAMDTMPAGCMEQEREYLYHRAMLYQGAADYMIATLCGTTPERIRGAEGLYMCTRQTLEKDAEARPYMFPRDLETRQDIRERVISKIIDNLTADQWEYCQGDEFTDIMGDLTPDQLKKVTKVIQELLKRGKRKI